MRRLWLRDYELILVLSPEVGEERMPAVMDRIHRFVTERGGEVTGGHPWGRRRLAYPIRKFIEGQYVLENLRLDPRTANAFESNLRLNEDVLRHILVRTGE